MEIIWKTDKILQQSILIYPSVAFISQLGIELRWKSRMWGIRKLTRDSRLSMLLEWMESSSGINQRECIRFFEKQTKDSTNLVCELASMCGSAQFNAQYAQCQSKLKLTIGERCRSKFVVVDERDSTWKFASKLFSLTGSPIWELLNFGTHPNC